MFGDRIDAPAVGVEDPVEIADVAGPERAREHCRVSVVAVATTEALVVRDVAGALLEIAHQASPLEDLGQQIRGLLARQVHTAELRDRVVSVVEEHPFVELLGTVETDRGVDGVVAADVEIADELVEEEATQRLVGSGCSGRTTHP